MARMYSQQLLVIALFILSLSSLQLRVNAQQVILPASTSIISPTIWPQPYLITIDETQANGGQTLYVNPDNFQVIWDQDCADRNPLLTQSQIIDQKLFPITAQSKQDTSLGELTSLFIHVDNPQSAFSIDNNQATSSETYNISIAIGDDGSGRATIYAPTAWGAIWGIESFVQLLSHENGNYLLYNSSVQVYDIPRFQYRGVNLDTSHHFLNILTMQHILDGMSANKMNVLHWSHKSAVAISMQSSAFPELTDDQYVGPGGFGGSFDEDLATYSQDDIFNLVEYARNRGIHIIVEHGGLEAAAALGITHPEIIACPDVLSKGYPAILDVALDPTINATYDFLAAYWHELDQISTDYVHLGGDRLVYDNCWKLNDNITNYLLPKGETYAGLQIEFLTNVWNGMMVNPGDGTPDSIYPLFSNNQSMMYRASVDNYPFCFPDDTVQMPPIWGQVLFESKDQQTLVALTLAGFDTIYAGVEWDLTNAATLAKHPVQNPYTNKPLRDIYDDWLDIYAYDIMQGVDSDPSIASFVMGGQVGLSTVQNDQDSVQATLWPRGSAAAERLWSNSSVTSQADDQTLFRIQSFICTLQRRGLKSASLRPGFCSTVQRWRGRGSGTITVSWILFGIMIAFSVIGALYVLSVILKTIAHLRAGTKAAVTASLNAPLMER